MLFLHMHVRVSAQLKAGRGCSAGLWRAPSAPWYSAPELWLPWPPQNLSSVSSAQEAQDLWVSLPVLQSNTSLQVGGRFPPSPGLMLFFVSQGSWSSLPALCCLEHGCFLSLVLLKFVSGGRENPILVTSSKPEVKFHNQRFAMFKKDC